MSEEVSEASAPPGWYPDPFGRFAFRWWDGAEWTGYADDTEVHWDLAPLAPPRPTPPGLPGLGLAVLGAAAGIALSIGVAAMLIAFGRPGGDTVVLAVAQLSLWAPLVAACVVVSRRRGSGSLSRDFAWRFRPRDVGIGLAGSIVGRIVAGVVILPIPTQLFDDPNPDRSIFDEIAVDRVGWVVLVAVVCIGAPLVEELFFRGLLQTRLVGRLGATRGIVTTSLLFGAAHLAAWQGTITLVYGFSIAGAGLVLGVIRHYSGTLGAPTAAHAFFNAQAVLAVALLG